MAEEKVEQLAQPLAQGHDLGGALEQTDWSFVGVLVALVVLVALLIVRHLRRQRLRRRADKRARRQVYKDWMEESGVELPPRRERRRRDTR